jgi:hypothetical protein
LNSASPFTPISRVNAPLEAMMTALASYSVRVVLTIFFRLQLHAGNGFEFSGWWFLFFGSESHLLC